MKHDKRYDFTLVIGCTGGGFTFETNDICEIDKYVDEYRHDAINAIWVWDGKHHDYIFKKRASCYKPEIDLLHNIDRDFRFKERHY